MSNEKRKSGLMLPMRILCIILAAIIWVFVVNITSDEYEKTYVVSIKTDGTETLNEKGMSIYDISQTQVSITVKGKRSEIQNITESQFRAYVDVAKLEGGGKHSVNVDVSIPGGLVLVETKPEKIEVYSDETATVDIPVEVKLKNYSFDTEYDKPVATCEIQSAAVRGPKSVPERIDHMIAVADLNNKSLQVSFSAMANLVPYDKNDAEIQSTFLTFEDTVYVDVLVIKRADVKLAVQYSAGVDSNKIESIVISPEKLTVKGESTLVDSVSPLTILTVNAQTPETSTVNVSDILPKGLTLVDKTTSVQVTIKYKAEEVTTSEVTTAEVTTSEVTTTEVTNPAETTTAVSQ